MSPEEIREALYEFDDGGWHHITRRRAIVQAARAYVPSDRVDPPYAEATPADVRLWLLDNGASERQWCETHDASRDPDFEGNCWLWTTEAEALDSGGCRMVSVLVYKEESE